MQINLEDFFYTLYPGAFFLTYWYIYIPFLKNYINNVIGLSNHDLFPIIIFLIASLFLGAILHGIWRSGKYIVVKKCKNETETKEFYAKNAVIWARNLRILPEFFSSRAALWGSTIVGLILSIILNVNLKYIWLYIIIIIIFFILCYFDNEKEKESVERIYDNLRKYDIPD